MRMTLKPPFIYAAVVLGMILSVVAWSYFESPVAAAVIALASYAAFDFYGFVCTLEGSDRSFDIGFGIGLIFLVAVAVGFVFADIPIVALSAAFLATLGVNIYCRKGVREAILRRLKRLPRDAK